MTHPARFLAHIHGVSDSRLVVGWLGGWLVVLLTARVTLPLKFPNEVPGSFVDTGVVIGLLVPILASTPFLNEGPTYLVRTASRSLVASRLQTALLVLGVNVAVGVLVATAAGVPRTLVRADVMVGTALLIAGVGLFTPRAGWLLPVGVFVVYSIPSLVSPTSNLLYRNDHLDVVQHVAVLAAMTGVVSYTIFGCVGFVGRFHWTGNRARDDGLDWQD